MNCENQNIVGNKCVKNDKGCLTCNDSAKLDTWKSHYERLLNVEFIRDSDSSSPGAKNRSISLHNVRDDF